MSLNRRQFAAISLGAALAPVASARERKFSLALTPGSIGVKANQREAIDLAHYHGFESVQPFGAQLAQLSDSESNDLVSHLKSIGLQWAAAGLPVDFRGDDDAKYRAGLVALSTEAAALQRAGVARMGTWMSPMSNTTTYRRNFQRTAQRIREMAAILDDHGMRLGLEYVGTPSLRRRGQFSFVHTMAETKELIHASGAGNVGFVLDSWHWWMAEENGDDIRTLDASDIVSCDINDAPTGIAKPEQHDTTRELPMATGVIPIKEFLAALVDLGYDGPVRAEPFNKKLNGLDNAEASAAVVRSMTEAVALVGG